MNNQSAKTKVFREALKVAVLSVGLALVIFTPVFTKITMNSAMAVGATPAQMTDSAIGNTSDVGGSQAIETIDTKAAQEIRKAKAAVDKGRTTKTWEQLKTWFREEAWKELKDSAAIAYKAALKNFLNNLAYDTATYLATGDKGQGPMFQTQGWGGYLQNAADNAAGTFIEALGKNMNYGKFNLCNPNFNVMLKINLGLVQSVRPEAPACTFSQMTKNWDKALTDKNFLPKFQDMFNPWSNDLGIALTVQTGMTQNIEKDLNAAIKGREEGAGFKAVTDKISGYIKSPSRTVLEAAGMPLREAAKGQTVYTGTILADSIDIFINTLAGKLIEKWLEGGLVSKFPKLTNKLDGLTNPNAQNQGEGAAGAKDRLKSIVEPNFKVRADYDILAELTTCPDPNKAGPTDCVIDEKFRQAIEKKLTVGQALEQGYLNGNGIFGFTSDGLEPKFNEGYPYRSMLILRKYRIIPVGWEVAAQKIKDQQNIVGGTKNLNDLVACSESDSGDNWCKDLVDPDWVLKAPQNFCKKEGAGPEIISEQVTGEGLGSSLAVLRNDAYCADEQSCIKEKTDGACQLYGYCTEERRKWDFNGNSCEPLYNTCQSFSSAAGQQVSYLENTLDFGVCNAGNAGCQKYARSSSVSGSYNPATKTVDWSKSADYVHLNKQAESCDEGEEGCRQLIRTKAGLGANLLINADFEEPLVNGDWNSFGIPSNDAYQGSHSLEISGAKSRNILVGSNLAGESWTLSFYAKNCAAGDKFWLGDNSKSSDLNVGADWIRYNLTYNYPDSPAANIIEFGVDSGVCLIDNIKLERGSQATNFSDYAAGPSLIQEKLLPNYLSDSCYSDQGDHYELKPNAPALCSNFARQCKEDEAGCELYTSVASDTKIPAKVTLEDYCPVECVGYNTFVQSETTFDSSRPAYFIPKTAKTCSAEAAGCDEFTNLEKISTTTPNVAEKKEYYTYLRQCVKQSDPASVCAEFYNWEGSDESGFQLKVESLKAINADINQQPALSAVYDSGVCDEATYNLPPADPHYNADCRQFYNRAGGIFYRLYSNTIDCTDDCHPYRRTALNTDDGKTQAQCGNVFCSSMAVDGAPQCWDNINSQCVVCKNGGTWSVNNQACIYMAVPDAGTTCSAQANGCREYVGNTGNNVRDIFTDDFTAGVSGWSGATPANAGIALGLDNQSHSIEVAAVAERRVGSAVGQGLDYVINFVAKGKTGPATLTFKLGNGLATSTFARIDAAPLELTTDWRIIEVNLTGLNHEPNAGETLRMETTGFVYIDSISLTEITDRFYLIKNSWRTPDSCDEDLAGRPAPLYMLGCAQYRDREDKLHNLKQFSKLCSESAVGCELMIDTENSSLPGASYYLDGAIMPTGTCTPGPTVDCVVVPADNSIYAVYDPEKLCGADAKGCERLGKQYKYGTATLYGDIYLKNNPDQYRTILCGADAVGCDGFAYDQGEKYFKDPGDQVCEYRQQKSGEGQSYGWYKKKVKRCDDGLGAGDVNGKIDATGNPLAPIESNICLADSNCSIVADKADVKCSKDSDCRISGVNECIASTKKCSVTGNSCTTINDCASLTKCVSGSCRYSCLADNNDYTCPTSDLKTLGRGGAGGTISQPSPDLNDNNWVGLCAAADSGCTEYLDPASKFNTNLIFNGGFQNLAGSVWDGWSSNHTQSVTLEPNTVYRLATEKINGLSPVDLTISCPDSALYLIGADNKLPDNSIVNITVTATNDRNSKIFYYKGAASVSCTVTAGAANGAVELKSIAIDYQLRGNLDTKTCNGIVNTGQGCVLFNERKQSGAGLAALTWDADLGQITGTIASEDKDSNVILKVAPDRVCDKWLACQSYIKDAKGDNVCFDIGLCDAVDANGNCQSFIPSKKANQVVGLDAAWISNLSGYSKVGISGGTLKTDYYPFGAMEQKGEVANFANGGFEYYGSNLYPVGWSWGNPAANKSWDANIFSVINNPIAAQAEGIGYAREGASFLKLGSSYQAVSEQIDVIPGKDYTITAYLNTKNLKSGTSSIDILNNVGGLIAEKVITQSLGNDWNFQMGKFNTGTNSQIKIKLYSSAGGTAGSEGNFYYDDIKIRPALESKCLEADGDCKTTPYNAWYTPQSCRLYPQSDSLACDYFEDSGKRQKGWPGYCLEYDRRPGDPNTCLLWYPIDKVKGDGIEEGAGYQGKVPLYYCTETTTSVLLNGTCRTFHQGQEIEIILSEPYIVWNVAEDIISLRENGTNKSVYGLYLRNYLDHKWTSMVQGTVSGNLRTWDASNDFGQIEMFDAVKIKCIDGDRDNNNCECSNFTSPGGIMSAVRCNQIAQTVNSVGNNKFWSSRVYLGSNYPVACNAGNFNASQICAYNSDSAPFGSIVPPAPTLDVLLNPYEWDTYLGENAPGNQPLYYVKEGDERARMGQSIAQDKLKRLFAQSYGSWNWGAGLSVCSNSSAECTNQPNDCPGGKCESILKNGYVCSGNKQECDPADPTDCSALEVCQEEPISSKECSNTGFLCVGQFCEGGTCVPQVGSSGGHYLPATGTWGPPGTNGEATCPDGVRPTTQPGDYCAIPPSVSNVKVNSTASGNVTLVKNGFINLTFNTKVDSNQLPLVMYGVDWGDDSNTMVTGVEMRDKQNINQPESVYHLYSYWDLKAKANSGIIPASSCPASTPGECQVKPKIQIKDNWGWCSGGTAINDCNQWQSFAGVVVVKEK